VQNRTGVFSFARYEEKFYSSDRDIISDRNLIIWRSCKVMVHEIAHMFGLRHCIFFDCIMNGSNNLEENDRKPLFLCPVCVRKLQHAIGFQMLNRYQLLAETCSEIGGKFEEAAEWYQKVYKLLVEAYGPHYITDKKTHQTVKIKSYN